MSSHPVHRLVAGSTVFAEGNELFIFGKSTQKKLMMPGAVVDAVELVVSEK